MKFSKSELGYILFVTLILLGIACLPAEGQTMNLPGQPPPQASVSWTAPSVCNSTTPCTFQVYRAVGTVACTVGSPGWTLVGTTPPQVGTYVDTTVTAGQTYTYAILWVQASMPLPPPGCGSGLIPNGNAPVTNVAVTGKA